MKYRCWLTGDMTMAGIGRSLKKELSNEWEFTIGQFNSWLADFLNPSSLFHIQKPEFALILLSPRFLQENPFAESQIDLFLDFLKSFDGQTQILVSTLAVDPMVPQRLLEAQRWERLAVLLNKKISDFQNKHAWFHLFDQRGFLTEHGVRKLHDPRYEVIGRTYFSPAGEVLLAQLLRRYLVSLTRAAKKVLVLDLDQTLWGGILGEDGQDGIRLSNDNGGYPFLRFHKALLELKKSGVLLALCSKNDEAHALKVFETHPDCILKPKDFVAHRINWLPKVENIRSLSEELNLGLSSFVFADDSQFEREQVKQLLPEVDVLSLSPDPAEYVQVLSDYDGFDTLRITEEDRTRSEMYQAESSRVRLKQESSSLESFYQSLNMKGEILPVSEKNIGRVHQLIQKTNQFNLTTRRYTEQQLREMMVSPKQYESYALRLTDKLGENGITGVMIVKKTEKLWELDTFLLSCRVIGRTVEFAWLNWLAERAKASSADFLLAEYISTPRNQVAAEFLAQAGFAQKKSKWELLLNGEIAIPKNYVQLTEVAHVTN